MRPLLVVLAACKLDSQLDPDAPPPVDQPIDQPPPRCDRTKAFGMPVLITELNTPAPPNDSFGARLSTDELTVYFSRITNTEAISVMTATRPTIGAPFGTPEVVSEVNTTTDDSNPMIDSTGLRIYLDSTRAPAASGGLDIYVATRGSPTGAFGVPQGVLAVDTVGDEHEPYVVEGGTAMFFTKDTGLGDIYESKGGPSGFGTPVDHPELSSAAFAEGHPVLSEDGLVIYFSSDRFTAGVSLNIFRASRDDSSSPFGAPESLFAIPSSPTWVSNDDCVLLLTAGRGGSSEGIFVARRPL